jgi:hypothetical protein
MTTYSRNRLFPLLKRKSESWEEIHQNFDWEKSRSLRRRGSLEAGNRHLLKYQIHFALQKVKDDLAEIYRAGRKNYLKLKEKRTPVKGNHRANHRAAAG